MKLVKILFCMCLFSCALFASSNEPNYNYTSVHNPHELWSIPFFASSSNKTYFTELQRAVEIISVTCDGKESVPEVYQAISGPTLETTTVDTTQFVYFNTYDNVASIVYEGNKINDDTKIKIYNIPKKTKKAIIRYIVHYPNNAISPICSVTSMNAEHLSYERN